MISVGGGGSNKVQRGSNYLFIYNSIDLEILGGGGGLSPPLDQHMGSGQIINHKKVP